MLQKQISPLITVLLLILVTPLQADQRLDYIALKSEVAKTADILGTTGHRFTSGDTLGLLEDKFSQQLLDILKYPESLSDSISFSGRSIQIAKSSDNKFTLFTWLTELGGTHWLVRGIAQWVDSSTAIHCKILPQDEGDGELNIGWVPALYHQAHPIRVQGTTCYLALGWNVWGGGISAETIYLFMPSGDSLKTGPPVFSSGQDSAPYFIRSHHKSVIVRLEYEPSSMTITYDNLVVKKYTDQEKEDDPERDYDPGWGKPDGTTRMLRLIDDRFQEVDARGLKVIQIR